MKKMTHSFILVAAIILNFAAFGQKKADNKVLMQIGSEKVMVKEFMDVFTKNNVQNEVIDKKSLDEYLDLYINFRLKVMEAMALKLDTNQAFIRELDGYRKQLAKPYFTDSKISDALLQEAYERKLQDIRASHILLMLDKNAPPQDTLEVWNRIMKIRERIINGEDFARVAVETSEDPSASDKEAIPNQRSFRAGNKGDLGYFSVFDMVYPFETGAYETEIGQLSMPLRSEFGYHLIKVTEKTPASGLI
ncbi:MAG: peptidylprolyl isomerase, partial [Bacteroidales bacterium]|nr:peptidylprolyl isomerase [Bacteroidales bacterium]